MPLALLALLLTGEPAAATLPAAQAQIAERIPAGAPKDDFGLVAWCDGALSGHMDLAERIQDIEPLDPVQTKIGKAYLAAYEKALGGSKESSTAAGRKRAAAARSVGWKNWDQARKTKDKILARDTYLAWQLPGVCEHAAIRLSGDKALFRMSLTPEEVEAMGEQTPVAGAHAEATQAADAAAVSAPVAASEDDLKIKTLPDPPAPAKSEAEIKADQAKARKDRVTDETWNHDHSTTTPAAPQ